MMKNQSAPIESTIPNNVEQNKSLLIPIKPKEEISKVSTPDSASYASYASTPSPLITHSSVLYGSSDSNDDPIQLSVNNNGYDTDDNEDDIDSIPLIERLTPPPPLFIDHLLTSSDDEYECDVDDDEECTFYNLSIDIPSLNLSNASPIDEQKERCTIFEICNNVTPANICYDVTSTPHINGKSNHEPIATEKRFNWDVANNDKTYIMDGYLSKHIHSLIDDNLSE